MKYLLDAGTVSAALRGRLPVVLKLAELGPGEVAMSVLSRMQVEIGLRTRPRAQARYARLLKTMAETVRILEFGEAEAQQAATLGAYLESLLGAGGERIGPMELMLAAQAMTHRYTLVAEDLTPYRMVTGLNVENWLGKAPEKLS
ncbi:MAG: type II toxin-antitoxin system VapC family toxin [Panacagrimonas sp.]